MSEPSKVLGLADLAYKFACQIMIGTNKELMPMFVIERGEQVDVIGTPFKDDNEKRTMVVNVALEIVEKGCDRWSFLSESWFAYREKHEPLGVRPSLDPKRQEGVLCVASDGKETLLYTWQTHRDEKGNCTGLAAPDDEGPKSFTSWISIALNKAKKLHEDFPV